MRLLPFPTSTLECIPHYRTTARDVISSFIGDTAAYLSVPAGVWGAIHNPWVLVRMGHLLLDVTPVLSKRWHSGADRATETVFRHEGPVPCRNGGTLAGSAFSYRGALDIRRFRVAEGEARAHPGSRAPP